MEINEEYFTRFKELTRKKLGDEAYEKMTEQELFDIATKLVVLVKAVYKPIPKDLYEKYTKELQEENQSRL
jgi:hypothetical protein